MTWITPFLLSVKGTSNNIPNPIILPLTGFGEGVIGPAGHECQRPCARARYLRLDSKATALLLLTLCLFRCSTISIVSVKLCMFARTPYLTVYCISDTAHRNHWQQYAVVQFVPGVDGSTETMHSLCMVCNWYSHCAQLLRTTTARVLYSDAQQLLRSFYCAARFKGGAAECAHARRESYALRPDLLAAAEGCATAVAWCVLPGYHPTCPSNRRV